MLARAIQYFKQVKQELECIYWLFEIYDKDSMKIGDWEIEFSGIDGYNVKSRAGEILLQTSINAVIIYGFYKKSGR